MAVVVVVGLWLGLGLWRVSDGLLRVDDLFGVAASLAGVEWGGKRGMMYLYESSGLGCVGVSWEYTLSHATVG